MKFMMPPLPAAAMNSGCDGLLSHRIHRRHFGSCPTVHREYPLPGCPRLRDRRYIDDTLRLWAAVFAANVLGAFCFALLAANTSALRSDIGSQPVRLGVESIGSSASTLFWSGVIGGWLIALVAWLVTASQWTIGQIAVIWLLAFVVGVGRFAHCIAGSGEILTAVLAGRVTAGAYSTGCCLAPWETLSAAL